MTSSKMTLEEFLGQEMNVDVHDDVLDRYYAVPVGPLLLTDAGRYHFRNVIGLPVFVDQDRKLATINLASAINWTERRYELDDLLDASMGYCPAADYARWFKE